MNFHIKKNATLPVLKLAVVKDGRSDYNNFMKQIEVSSIFFSMIDTETGVPKIMSRPASFVGARKTVPFDFVVATSSTCNPQHYMISLKKISSF